MFVSCCEFNWLDWFFIDQQTEFSEKYNWSRLFFVIEILSLFSSIFLSVFSSSFSLSLSFHPFSFFLDQLNSARVPEIQSLSLVQSCKKRKITIKVEQTNKLINRQTDMKKNRNLRTAKCFQDNYHHFVLINFVQVKRKYLQIHSLDFWFTFPLSLSHLKK